MGSTSHRLPCLDLARLPQRQGSSLLEQVPLPTRVSPILRALERYLPGVRKELGYSIGEEDIRSLQDILCHNLTNHTNYPGRIHPGLRQRPINRATPHSFLPPQRTAITTRVIPILPHPVSLHRITLLPTQRMNSIRITLRRTHPRTITKPSNRPISTSASPTPRRLITFPTLWPTTPNTLNIIPMATTCHSRTNSNSNSNSNNVLHSTIRARFSSLSNVVSFSGKTQCICAALPVELFSLCFNTPHDYPTLPQPILLCERSPPQCPLLTLR